MSYDYENNNDFFNKLEWNKATEELLMDWGDIAACYVWMHDQCYRRFNNFNYRFSIPIIILSTVTGTLSMSLNTILPSDYITTGQVLIGGVNIFTGIITTLQNFFKHAQKSESHLNAATEWAKFERNIKIELAIDRESRKKASDFIRLSRHDYERLHNNNPIIPEDILEDYRDRLNDLDIGKPILVKALEKTKVYSEYKSPDPTLCSTPKVSYLKRLASLIPFTKTYKLASGRIKNASSDFTQIFMKSSPIDEPRTLSLKDIKSNLENSDVSNNVENITIDTKSKYKEYDCVKSDLIISVPDVTEVYSSDNLDIEVLKVHEEK